MSSAVNLYQCRLCLKRTPTRVNIYGGDFPKMLEILTSIKVRENDGLPKYSCSKCAQEVKTALLVKKRIVKAHRTLVEDLKNKQKLFERKAAAIGAIDVITNKDVKTNSNLNSPKVIPQISNKPIPKLAPISNPSKEQIPIEFVNIAGEGIKIEQVELSENRDDMSSYQKILNQRKVASLTCQICDLKFLDKPSYNLHSAKHKKTKCHICGRLIRSDNIKKHVMLHTAGPSVCQMCGATCKNIESLRGHIFYQHKSSAEQYVCDECGKGFRIKYKFLLHKKKAHQGLRNFKCETCGKGFFTNGNLMTHVKMTHEKLRPHVCEFCGTGFSSTYALKTHKRQHTNEKPFVCDFCEEGFRQRVSLRSHLKSKHGVEESKAFGCKSCSKGFATNYALSIHERLHMSEKCEVCSETFSGEYLKNHLKDVHNIHKDSETVEENKTE